MTRTSRLDFGSAPDSDPAHRCDTKRKLFSLAEVCAPPSAVLVFLFFYTRLMKKMKVKIQQVYKLPKCMGGGEWKGVEVDIQGGKQTTQKQVMVAQRGTQ